MEGRGKPGWRLGRAVREKVVEGKRVKPAVVEIGGGGPEEKWLEETREKPGVEIGGSVSGRGLVV